MSTDWRNDLLGVDYRNFDNLKRDDQIRQLKENIELHSKILNKMYLQDENILVKEVRDTKKYNKQFERLLSYKTIKFILNVEDLLATIKEQIADFLGFVLSFGNQIKNAYNHYKKQ